MKNLCVFNATEKRQKQKHGGLIGIEKQTFEKKADTQNIFFTNIFCLKKWQFFVAVVLF
jgi:hypothetical protein